MGIYSTVNEQMKEAMKAREKARLSALRGIRAAFIETMKKDNSETLADEACLGILRRLAKQRAESVEAYTQGGRTDLAESEAAELAVIEAFLPQLADQGTTPAWVAEAVASTGASSPADMGRVMGHLMQHHRGEIDGKLANQLVRSALAG